MDKVLKQRLIGASILIALAVIFIPMLFDAPEDDLADRQMRIDIPDPPSDRASVRRMPLDPDGTRVRADGPGQGEGNRQDAGQTSSSDRSTDDVLADIEANLEPNPRSGPEAFDGPEQTDSGLATEAERESGPESEPSPQPAGPSREVDATAQDPLATGDWVLQVASFSVEDNAVDLTDQLARLGHVATVSLLVRGDTTLHRVVTGPYSSRTDAERAKGQIERTVAGVAPVVRGNPSVERSPGANGELSAGFAVQVGSFASRNNAVRLLGQLESEEFEAFIHEDLNGRRTIWRVRVGLAETREQATALLSEIADRTALEGLVVSHP